MTWKLLGEKCTGDGQTQRNALARNEWTSTVWENVLLNNKKVMDLFYKSKSWFWFVMCWCKIMITLTQQTWWGIYKQPVLHKYQLYQNQNSSGYSNYATARGTNRIWDKSKSCRPDWERQGQKPGLRLRVRALENHTVSGKAEHSEGRFHPKSHWL